MCCLFTLGTDSFFAKSYLKWEASLTAYMGSSGLARQDSGNKETRKRRSLVLHKQTACKSPCLGCYPSPAPNTYKGEFQGDNHCCGNFNIFPQFALQDASLPVGVRCWEGLLPIQITHGCSHSSVPAGFSESQWGWVGMEEGSWTTSEKWKWQARALRGKGQAWQCATRVILRGDGGMKVQIWPSLVSLSSEVCGGRHLDFPGSRLCVYGWVISKAQKSDGLIVWCQQSRLVHNSTI